MADGLGGCWDSGGDPEGTEVGLLLVGKEVGLLLVGKDVGRATGGNAFIGSSTNSMDGTIPAAPRS